MMGSFLSRALLYVTKSDMGIHHFHQLIACLYTGKLTILILYLQVVFGYAYPAYECFKTVEKNKPEMEQLFLVPLLVCIFMLC